MRASSFPGYGILRYTAIRRFKIKRYPTYTHPARVTNTAVRRATGQVSTRPDGDHGHSGLGAASQADVSRRAEGSARAV